MRAFVTRYLIPGAALLATFAVSGALVFAVASFVLGSTDGSSDETAALPPTVAPAAPTSEARTASTRTAPAQAVTPAPTLSATASATFSEPTAEPPEATATLTEPPVPTASAPTPASVAASDAAQAPASFAGVWRIVDTVTLGRGVGQSFAFQVSIAQFGASLSGGAGAISLDGTVAGDIATVAFSQPALGVTGVFIWTLQADGNATGTFTSSVPNSGTSELIRLQ